jgi:hypothetical protein
VNKVIAIALIFVMSAQSLCKLGMITYFEINRDYIAKVLCINKSEPKLKCNGQCYLKKSIKETEETVPVPATRSTGKETVEIPIFIVSEHAFNSSTNSTESHDNFPPVKIDVAEFSPSYFHPPAVIC